MNTLVWILQIVSAFIFLYSGINKAYYDEKTLVGKGQTGVEGLPGWFIKFIGLSEIFGSVGLILPWAFCLEAYLTPISSLCLGLIMIPAAIIHQRRKEGKNVLLNLIILAVCLTIAYSRFIDLGVI